jgi:hypothetical protein
MTVTEIHLGTDLASGFEALAAHIREHGPGDIALLGLPRMPEPGRYMLPAQGSDDEERRARVDAFARRYGVKAGWDALMRTYQATVWHGPVALVAYAVAAASDEEVREWARDRRERLKAAACEDQAAASVPDEDAA